MKNILFIEPNTQRLYQALATNKISAIETPTWSLLLAQSCRSKGFGVSILDANAESLSIDEATQRIIDINPHVACFVVYGQNPNSGTTNMSDAIKLCEKLKDVAPYIKTMFIGTHTSALPRDVLSYSFVDFISIGEGVYTLHQLLETDLETDLEKVCGLGFKKYGVDMVLTTSKTVPIERMDIDLPGYAWDLLPYNKKPFDLYRAHNWHVGYDESLRTPFAAIYTSLGCQFSCSFCMINIVNRTNPNNGIMSSDSNFMRFWSPELIAKEFKKLADYGVHTVRISDEMFFLNKKYYEPLLNELISTGISEKLRTWTYSRIDTVNERFLQLFNKAGVKWLALGIEAANQEIRADITKGRFKNVNVRDVVKLVRDYGINVGANYIFGFPNEKEENLQQTLDLALELNADFTNMYCATALPGSPLYYEAQKNNWPLPDTFEGYGFLSYEHLPLRTNYLTAKEVLAFRDSAWHKCFESKNYLDLVERKFGVEQRNNVEKMSKIKLKRKILGD